MADKKGGEDDFSGQLILGAMMFAVVAVVAVPVALAMIVWFVLRNRFARREWLLMFGFGAIATGLRGQYIVTSYFSWLMDIAQGRFTLTSIPLLSIAVMILLLAPLAGLLQGTSVAKRLPKALGKYADPKKETESILPTDKQRKRAAIAKPPGGALTVAADANSVLNPVKPGKRQFPIGYDANGTPVMLSENEIRMHGLIIGSTGSGKSETIKALAGCLLDLGWSVMVLDLKEDTAPGGLRDFCFDYATFHSMHYQELRLSDPNPTHWFNPLHGMGPDEARDTILSLAEFDDQYWQNINKKMLGQLVNLSFWAHEVDPVQFPAPTMYELGRMLDGSLPSTTKKMRAAVLSSLPGVVADDLRVLSAPTQDEQKSATGFGSKLTQIYDTQAGRAVLRAGTAGSARALLDVTADGVTYIGLDSQGKADLTKMVSSAVLQRMSVYAAQRSTGQITAGKVASKRPLALIVDEANWIERTVVQGLLSRARSAGIAMFLCTQGPKDWIDKNGDDWAKLVQNTNVAFLMSQGEPESAEICADYVGKMYKAQVSDQLRGTTSVLTGTRAARDRDGNLMESQTVREQLVHIIDPDDFRRLGIGEMILRVGKPTERISWVQVQMRDPRSGPVRS